MEWLRRHLYTAVSGLVGILVVGGAVVVVRHSPQPPASTLTAWDGSGTPLLNPASYAPNNPILGTVNTNIYLGGANPSFGAIPPSTNTGDGETGGQSDIRALIEALSDSGANVNGTVTVAGSSGGSLAYAFIPGGLISTTTATKKRTDTQQALYDYGNELGGYILSYDDTHAGDAILLTNQARDRQNPQKAQAVRDTGAALGALGQKLAAIDTVPASVASMNADLAASYKEMGAKLALIPDAERDEDFIKAVTAYNGAVDTFTKRYVDLATFFSVSGVVFGAGDGGSVFTFSGGGSL